MSPKTKKAAPAKAKSAEKSVKLEKSSGKKGAKASKEAIESSEIEMKSLEAKVDEDAEEEEEVATSSTSSAGGNAAALAAATGTTEMSASFKNFRHHPDMENFYRFIYENDLRLEALGIINEMMTERAARKTLRTAKSNTH